MAKAQQNFSKKETEKKKQQKQKEKEERRAARQANAASGQSLDDMMAYVDEDGNIVSTPPDPTKKRVIKDEDIQISVTRQEDRAPEDPTRHGTVSFFNDSKGFGFIKDQASQESIFVHVNALGGLKLSEGMKVTFETEPGMKGPVAVRVRPASATPPAPAAPEE
jgi:cold shock CspA family protein